MIASLIIVMLGAEPAELKWTIAPDGSLIRVAVEREETPPTPGETDGHVGKPTVEPKRVTHRTHSSHLDWCMMCLGQHLRNAHGERVAGLDAMGYGRWPTHHAGLHSQGRYQPASPAAAQCSGGRCGLPLRRWKVRR